MASSALAGWQAALQALIAAAYTTRLCVT